MFTVTRYDNNATKSVQERWSAERIMRWMEAATGFAQDANQLKMWNATTTIVVHDCEVL